MIIRRKHTGNFAVIPNILANDEQLQADTLGVLVYLLAKPSDWAISVGDIRKRFGIGRNRVYAMLAELIAAGYVEKFQNRKAGHSRFVSVEYRVYDCPPDMRNHVDAAQDDGEPLPQNREAEKPQQNAVSPISASPKAVMRESGKILNTDSTKPSSKGNSTPDGAGAKAPSVNVEVWKEALTLLKTTSLPEAKCRTLIGQWSKRAPSEEDKARLLAIVRAAARAGTGDPVSYISKAVNDAFPPPPDPKAFDAATWRRNVTAAMSMKAWAPQWGPVPGAKGCLVPGELVTLELIEAVQPKRRAA